MIVDGFLDDFESLRMRCDTLSYSGYVNPVDGVEYPGISVDILEGVSAEVIYKLQRIVKRTIVKKTLFLRLSVEGHKAPHQSHNDELMGQYAMMLYLSRGSEGALSFLKHKELGFSGSLASIEHEIAWNNDTNNYDAWKVVGCVDMAPNRAVIFPANQIHRAEPVAGFGDSVKNGRLVMVCFFDVADD